MISMKTPMSQIQKNRLATFLKKLPELQKLARLKQMEPVDTLEMIIDNELHDVYDQIEEERKTGVPMEAGMKVTYEC